MRAKTLSRTTAAALLAIALCACGSKDEAAPPSDEAVNSASSAANASSNPAGAVPPAPLETGGDAGDLAKALPVELEGGILRTVTQAGQGPVAASGDEVRFQFSSHLADSDKVLSSSAGWDEPCRVQLGAGEHTIVPGLERALAGLAAGARARIEVPAELAYGKDGLPASGIPAGAKLVFDVQILGVSTR